MSKLEIDTDTLDLIVKDADSLMVNPDGERVLLQFFKFKDQILLMESIIKEKLGERMEEMSPNQKSVIGDHIKITKKTAYETGKKYRFEGDYEEQFANRLERVYLNPNTSKIDEFMAKEGKLPDGVKANDMKPQIEIKITE